MAPTRKKKTTSAAAASAAAAQWKVGDLVLAKLKGYTAWPAKISEPQQWGKTAVKNKLMVYFYGTKEIGFCNYADLEAFTEEKKKSLLVKRHGKGADFVRAVKEIVEIFDSTKKEDNGNSGLAPANNSSSLDTRGREEGSDLANDSKLDGNPASSMDHSMASTPGSNIAAGSEHCVVDSAPDEPTSLVSKKRQNNAQQLDSFTNGNLASARKPRSSLGADHRTRDSCRPNGPNRPSVDMTPEDKQEGSSRYKFIGDDKPNSDFLSAKKDVMLFNCSQGTSSQSGTSGNGSDEKNSSSAANVESTLNVEACQTVMDREDNLNEMQDLSTSTTVTFKRKRKPDTNDINNSIISMVPNMDEELQPKSSGNIPDSPNSGNEVNKSDGDDHLPLVKRARVRMGRPQLEDSIIDESDISDNKTELAMPVDQCYQHDLSSVVGKDYLADEVLLGIDPSPGVDLSLASGKESSADEAPPCIDPSPEGDLSLVSGEVQTACNNKECQSKVLTLDGEAALPPSKRLHRALEAMSANAAETINYSSEVNKPNEFILNGCTPSIASSPANNSADAPVKSPKTAPTKIPKICATAYSLDTPTGQMYTSLPVIINKDSPSSVSLELTNGSNHDLPKDKVCTRVDDVCGKSPTCSLESKEPAVVSKLDQLPLGKATRNELPDPVTSSGQDFINNNDGSVHPLSPAKTVLSANDDCNSLSHDMTVLAEPTASVGDRASVSSLVTKVTCSQSIAGAQTFEAHGSLAMSLKEPDRRIYPKDTSLSPDSMPMKELIAAAHARRLSQPTSFIDNFLDSNVLSPSANIPSAKEGSGGRCSPSSNNNTISSAPDRIHTQQNSGTILFDDMEQKSLNKLPGHDEARSARRAFENFLGTLTRTKESIARATRLALDCAKHGIAGEVMDVIIERLEKESNLYKRVDLFFLVDSIIQCCRNQKGGVGDAYPSLIQAVLPRILYASAPPGNSAWENRRQCLKVLKLWLQRKTLSEYIIRHHIKELETLNEAAFGTSRRPSGTERALNDPLRDNEGMLVDEYGSNTGFHLPNLIGTKLLDEEGSSSEDRSFEAVTPEHESASANDQEGVSQVDGAKHRLVFEEVNGDLEMEDVAPSEAKASSAPDLTNRNVNSVPPLPDDKPPTPPPLPSSPPPLPRQHCPVLQGSQVQGASHVAADRVEPDNLRNVQDQHPHSIANNRGNMDPCVVPFQPPGCAAHTNQILPPLPPPPPPPPVAQFHPPGPHGNFAGPPVPHHGNNYHHPPSGPLPNNAYHLQPPPPHPPGPPNQFPYMPPEPQQRTQPWNNCPYPEGYQYNGHDRGHHPFDRRHHFDDRWHHFDDRGRRFDGGHHFDAGGHYFDDGPYHYDDRGHHFNDRGQMHPEAVDRGRFPPHFGPEPPYPDHFDHGRPMDHPPGPWSMPPRRSKYPPGSRHSMEPPISHEGGWRRHGRHNNDRFNR